MADRPQLKYGQYVDYAEIDKDVIEVRQGEFNTEKPITLIIGDSRVETLHEELKDRVTTPYIINSAFGLKTHDIYPIIENTMLAERIDFVIIMTGSCDLVGMLEGDLVFEENDEEIPPLVDEILAIYRKQINRVSKLNSGTKTVIAGFYGVELHNYNEQETRQDALNNATWDVNHKIHNLNKGRGMPNLRIDSLIHKNLTKIKRNQNKRSHSYKRTEEGYHPSTELNEAVALHVGRLFGSLLSIFLQEKPGFGFY